MENSIYDSLNQLQKEVIQNINDDFVKEYDETEVVQIFKKCNVKKLPGPNDLPFEFNLNFWNLIKKRHS